MTGAAGEAAARPVALDGRRGRGSATARPQGRGETRAAGTGPRLEPATPMHAQSMEVGGPGAPIPDAAELAVEAHRLALGLSLSRLSMEERHALEIQQQLRTATHILVHQESHIRSKFVQHLINFTLL